MERKILNGNLEIALRALAILVVLKKPCTLDRIALYSYFAIYNSDMKAGLESLHPNLPYRFKAILQCKDAMRDALSILISRNLITNKLHDDHICFEATKNGELIYEQIDSEYKNKLGESITRVSNNLDSISDSNLIQEVYKKAFEWGREFVNESVLNENYGEE